MSATLIASQVGFTTLMESLRGVPLLAVDTEAASFHRHLDRIYLIQVSTRTETWILDPLGIEDLSPFGELLADEGVEIIFHDADYDLRLFDHQYQFRATKLFDTRIAAQLLNEPGIGLAALLEKHFGEKLDKRYQRADWSARPLTPPMLDYAAADTRHLAELRDIMRNQLAAAGRLAWAEEEFKSLESLRYSAADDRENAYLRIKGARTLHRRELAVLRELFAWRDELARSLDRAAFRIMGNDVMLDLAKAPPADLEALATRKGVGRDIAERRGAMVMTVIQHAMSIPERDLPRIERPPRRVPDPAYEARLEKLKAARNTVAERLSLAPGVACANGVLEAVARAHPQNVEELAALPEIRRWQIEAVGPDLLAAIKTP